MSCFIIDHKTLVNVSTTLNHHDYANGGKYAVYATWTTPKEQLDRLMRQLWIVNHKAYRKRYHHHGFKSGFYSIKSEIGKWGEVLSPAQLVKSLQCLRYQCTEFDEDKEPRCLKTLDLIIRDATYMLVDLNPDYQKAVWG